ncbi:MAG: oxidoreductase [Cellulomonadaceae bacterium]
MGLFGDLFSRRRAGASTDTHPGGSAKHATLEHLASFVATRTGVEAYIEPETKDTPPTIMLIATDGEWTRRRVPDERTAWATAKKLAVPVYNVRFTGYPQRMRDWNSRQRGRKLT